MKRSKSKRDPQSARFLKLRQRLQSQQGDLLAQFQREVRKIPADDGIAVTRLKLVYRRKGLNI